MSASDIVSRLIPAARSYATRGDRASSAPLTSASLWQVTQYWSKTARWRAASDSAAPRAEACADTAGAVDEDGPDPARFFAPSPLPAVTTNPSRDRHECSLAHQVHRAQRQLREEHALRQVPEREATDRFC